MPNRPPEFIKTSQDLEREIRALEERLDKFENDPFLQSLTRQTDCSRGFQRSRLSRPRVWAAMPSSTRPAE